MYLFCNKLTTKIEIRHEKQKLEKYLREDEQPKIEKYRSA